MVLAISFSTKLLCVWIIAGSSIAMVSKSEDEDLNKKVCGLSALLMALVMI